jgi:hypothetical protein
MSMNFRLGTLCPRSPGPHRKDLDCPHLGVQEAQTKPKRPKPIHAREPAFVGLLLYIEYQKVHTFTFVTEYSIGMGIASF